MRLACCSEKGLSGTALTCEEEEQAQGHLLHDGASLEGGGEGPALAELQGCHEGLWFPIPSYSTPHPGFTPHPRVGRLALKAERGELQSAVSAR